MRVIFVRLHPCVIGIPCAPLLLSYLEGRQVSSPTHDNVIQVNYESGANKCVVAMTRFDTARMEVRLGGASEK